MCIWPIVDVIGLSCLEQKKMDVSSANLDDKQQRGRSLRSPPKRGFKLQVYWHSRLKSYRHSGLPPASLMLTRNFKWLSWASKISIYGCMRMPKMFVSFVPVFTCFPYCGVIFFPAAHFHHDIQIVFATRVHDCVEPRRDESIHPVGWSTCTLFGGGAW